MAGSVAMERKIISVTGKRQITIPKKFYNILRMGKEIECELTDNAIILRPFSVPSQQKWTQKSSKKRNESQYFVDLRKPTAFIPRFA